MSNMKSALVGYPSGQDGPIPPDGIARSGLPAGFDPAQGKEVCVTDLNSSKFRTMSAMESQKAAEDNNNKKKKTKQI